MAKKHFFQYVGKTRVVPIQMKILIIFVALLLISNFMTNLISVRLSMRQVIGLTNLLTVTQLKEMYKNAENQYRIYSFTGNRNRAIENIGKMASDTFTTPRSMALGFDKEGNILFIEISNIKPIRNNNNKNKRNPKKNIVPTKFNTNNANPNGELRMRFAALKELETFPDKEALERLNSRLENAKQEGRIRFKIGRREFFGAYKYSKNWDAYLVRAESVRETSRYMNAIMFKISGMIIVLTIIFVLVGIFMFNRIFANISKITKSLSKMQQDSKLDVIDIEKAPSDDITYFAASFNSLSVSVNNLLMTFQKFVSKDVVSKAYADHTIKLEGMQRELTILFSDIKSFTYRTETLGNEIIDLLNVHYNSVIHDVHTQNGVIGSIIGDAILAIFGSYDNASEKSIEAINAAWEITYVTAEFRQKMKIQRIKIEETRSLTEAEERVYHAVLLDIGVGIDGGTVFYGNIGSDEHMTNTVIGDNVNSASRLEGVTRIYHLPVIVSEYVFNEVEGKSERYKFYEIDTIQVKGKTQGKRIFYPLDTNNSNQCQLIEKFERYKIALEAYYTGDWKTSKQIFKDIDMEVCNVFLDRMGTNDKAPDDWSGIWTMTTK